MCDGVRKSHFSVHPDGRAVFTAFGRVAYAVQIFEADITTLLIILRMLTQIEKQVKTEPESFLNRKLVGSWWQTQSEEIQGELTRYTLGQLLKNELKRSRENLKKIHVKGENVIPADKLKTINGQLDSLPVNDWEKALIRRNELFHGFFYHADDQLIHAKGCCELREKLVQDKKHFERHVVNVREALKKIMDIMGYRLDGIDQV